MKQKRAYKYRFYPTDEQQNILAHTFGCTRFVYNWALRKKTDAYYKDGVRLSYNGPAPNAALSMTEILMRLEIFLLLDKQSMPVERP